MLLSDARAPLLFHRPASVANSFNCTGVNQPLSRSRNRPRASGFSNYSRDRCRRFARLLSGRRESEMKLSRDLRLARRRRGREDRVYINGVSVSGSGRSNFLMRVLAAVDREERSQRFIPRFAQSPAPMLQEHLWRSLLRVDFSRGCRSLNRIE